MLWSLLEGSEERLRGPVHQSRILDSVCVGGKVLDQALCGKAVSFLRHKSKNRSKNESNSAGLRERNADAKCSQNTKSDGPKYHDANESYKNESCKADGKIFFGWLVCSCHG